MLYGALFAAVAATILVESSANRDESWDRLRWLFWVPAILNIIRILPPRIDVPPRIMQFALGYWLVLTFVAFGTIWIPLPKGHL